jgi:hypothetical protein
MRARVHAQGPADGTKDADKTFHSADIIFGAKRDGAAPSVMRYPAVKPWTIRRGERACIVSPMCRASTEKRHEAFHSADIIFDAKRDGATPSVMRYPSVKPCTIRRGERACIVSPMCRASAEKQGAMI